MAVKFRDRDSGETSRRMEEAAGKLERLASSLQQNNLEGILDRALKSTRRDLEKSIQRLVEDSILTAFGGKASGSGGVASLLAGLIPGFSRGGIISSRTPVAHTGETGPEVVLPLKRGRDGRLGIAMEAGRPQQQQPIMVTVNQDAPQPIPAPLDGTMTEAITAAVTRAVDDAIDQRLALHQQPGGMLHEPRNRGW